MRTIDLPSWPRRKHFAFFNGYDQPHFGLCAPLEVTHLHAYVQAHGLSFTPALVYLLARAANDAPAFRCRIRGAAVVEHEVVHPSVTVMGDADLFGFCSLAYQQRFPAFARDAAERMAQARQRPALATEPDRDDLLYMTAIPWVSFTSFLHPTHDQGLDSVPRFAWGKIYAEGEMLKMPLSVQAHHALMDGLHMGRYFEAAQAYLERPGAVLEEV